MVSLDFQIGVGGGVLGTTIAAIGGINLLAAVGLVFVGAIATLVYLKIKDENK